MWKVKEKIATVRQFCLIQLEILKEKEVKIRKEFEECKLQQEFLTKTLIDLKHDHKGE
jgi:FtsZ-binding cell division protein ZapB